MKRFAMLLCVAILAAPLHLSSPAMAQAASQSGVKAKSSARHKVPMHPSTLTLYPNGRPKPRHSAHWLTQHPYNQPAPIHNTFMGPRYY